MKSTDSRTIFLPVILTMLVVLTGCDHEDANHQARSSADLCPAGTAVETDGVRRLALIAGVGDYESSRIPDLTGPPHDAHRIYDLLTGKHGYGFPQQNVCLMLDADASRETFMERFNTHLVERAQKNDIVVIYFAGHGGQTRDNNRDEPDELDETLLFHDASAKDASRDLSDDQLHGMLKHLNSKTENIVLILDSCNSGSAQRGAHASPYRSRFFARDLVSNDEQTAVTESGGDAGSELVSQELPGLITLTAARDGTAALEIDSQGIFTSALVEALSEGTDTPFTYAQLARQVPLLVAARSDQIPSFQGDLQRMVFGVEGIRRPLSWEVVDTGDRLTVGGPPLPGYIKGSELRIYDGNSTGDDTQDPGKAKATVIIETVTGLTARARVLAAHPDKPGPKPGDLAVLVRPGDDYLRIKVRLRQADEPGGIPTARAQAIRSSIEAHPEAGMLVEVTDGPGEFELSVGHDDTVQLMGPENTVRIQYERDSAIARNLWQHARQRALLLLRGEGGQDFTDNHTLKLQLIPAGRQGPCADGEWVQAQPNSEQIIPLCHRFNIRVALREDTQLGMLDKDTPAGLQVGGVILSADGSIFGFPTDGRIVRIAPGETAVFDLDNETFTGIPPLNVRDRIIVFGTRETNPVPWHRLSQTASSRALDDSPKNALYSALDRYMQPDTRAIGQAEIQTTASMESETWTLSSITARVEANPGFLKAAAPGQPVRKREYTINDFDIRPYLPDDTSSALYKVMTQAHWLTSRSGSRDGYPYKQHDWSLPDDKQNLARGIDCSRAIWFAFTRANITYNRDDRYLSTAMMSQKDSLMSDSFKRCDSDPLLRTGDVLVYRDEQRDPPDGHVVMVIDPHKRIAWGSHGWDGNEDDRGVEYQLIRYKQDWARWDRKTMFRKACWRHEQFIADVRSGRDIPGIRALTHACSSDDSCGITVQ